MTRRHDMGGSVCGGFTMLELLVVIMIAIIIAGVAAPRIFGTLATSRLRSETQRLMAAMQYCQGMAALQRTPYRFHFNLDEQCYYVTRDPSKGDDFELEGTGTLGGADGYGRPSLYAGTRSRGEDAASNSTDRVDIFDSDTHYLPRRVVMLKIVDGRGEEITSGNHSVVLDPKGTAVETAIYLTTDREKDPVYIVRLGANGITEIERDDSVR